MNYKYLDTIEKVIHLVSLYALKSLDGYDRLYIGDDFCERLTPDAYLVEKIIELARLNNKEITLLTAYYTDKGLEDLKVVLDILNSYRLNIEVVINDMGVLRVLRNYFPNLTPVFGRLNTSFFWHPNFCRRGLLDTSSKLWQACRKKIVLIKEYFRFLQVMNIRRVEFDNLFSVSLFSDYFLKENIAVSLYYPFTYLTTTRRCLFAARKEVSSKFALFGCKKECLDYRLVLRNKDFGYNMLVRGNAQFIKVEFPNILSMCKEFGIDRLITFTI